MPLDLKKYITKTKDYRSGLRKYILEHPDQYDLDTKDPTDDDIRKLMNRRFNKLSPGEGDAAKERDSFRKCTKGLFKGSHQSTDRLNQYRILYALMPDLPDRDLVLNEANNILLRYLYEPELTARNLMDFIMIAAIKKGYGWAETNALYQKHKEDANQISAAPDNLEEGFTQRLFNLINRFEEEDDLEAFLDCPDNLLYFSVTNNTRYIAFFDSFQIRNRGNSIELVNDKHYFNDDGELTRLFNTMIVVYHTIFGLVNMDDSPECNEEFALTDDDISRLAKIFPSVFLTYDSFRTLTQRTRRQEISHGNMLLKILEEMDPNPGEGDYINFDYVDFNNPLEVRECINNFFQLVGLPDLSMEDPFDMLVMDTHEEVLRENPGNDSVSIKSKFFRRLRQYCKTIAKM